MGAVHTHLPSLLDSVSQPVCYRQTGQAVCPCRQVRKYDARELQDQNVIVLIFVYFLCKLISGQDSLIALRPVPCALRPVPYAPCSMLHACQL